MMMMMVMVVLSKKQVDYVEMALEMKIPFDDKQPVDSYMVKLHCCWSDIELVDKYVESKSS
jgi:hypothetical protein